MIKSDQRVLFVCDVCGESKRFFRALHGGETIDSLDNEVCSGWQKHDGKDICPRHSAPRMYIDDMPIDEWDKAKFEKDQKENRKPDIPGKDGPGDQETDIDPY